MTLLSPSFGYFDQEEAQRQVPLMKAISYFATSANLPSFKIGANKPYFMQNWVEDPLVPTNMPMKTYLA